MKNMRKITKIRRSIKAISPVISVLLMIAIAVVASLVVYAWIMGYIGGTTTKTGQAIQIQSYAVSPDGTTLYVYVQNVGQGTVNFDPSACVYVNNEGKSASIGSNSLNAGYTATLTITGLSLDVTKSVSIKVVTSGGTYMEASGVPPVTAGGANHAPVATADSYSTNVNTPLSVAAPGVLTNDNDPDGNTITAVQVSGTSHSSAFTLNADGSFSYTPVTGYTGSDSFTYHAYDGSLYSNTVTVTITVNSVNHAPVATADSYSTNVNTPLSVAAPGVLTNDNDPDGNTITAVQVSGTSHSSAFTLNADGSFSYTPVTGYTGSDSFTYHAYDGSLDSNTVAVSITVNAVHVPPAIDVSGTGTRTSGNTYTITLNTNNANEIIYIAVATGSSNTASVSGGGLTWTQRGNSAISGTRTLQTFWALKATSGSITITINCGGASSSAVAFAISGANTASPFDTTNPRASTGTSTAPSTTITTTNANDFIIGVVGIRNQPTITKGASFTLIGSVTSGDPEVSAEYMTVTATQTNLSVGYTLNSSQDWAMIADAVKGT
jgi:VCBS repeat-containing protein